LTHARTVEIGDRLPLMTHQIYDDQSYYLKVAKANGLTSFRKLTVGKDINFPPIGEPI
jgi:nucleoid-associated protein YgaU